jgi:hypothetical protein
MVSESGGPFTAGYLDKIYATFLKSQNPYFLTKFQKLMFHAHEMHAHESHAYAIQLNPYFRGSESPLPLLISRSPSSLFSKSSPGWLARMTRSPLGPRPKDHFFRDLRVASRPWGVSCTARHIQVKCPEGRCCSDLLLPESGVDDADGDDEGRTEKCNSTARKTR